MERVDDVAVERYRPDLAALAAHAQVDRAAAVVRAALVKGFGRERPRLL
jgi:hypothetical protein